MRQLEASFKKPPYDTEASPRKSSKNVLLNSDNMRSISKRTFLSVSYFGLNEIAIHSFGKKNGNTKRISELAVYQSSYLVIHFSIPFDF